MRIQVPEAIVDPDSSLKSLSRLQENPQTDYRSDGLAETPVITAGSGEHKRSYFGGMMAKLFSWPSQISVQGRLDHPVLPDETGATADVASMQIIVEKRGNWITNRVTQTAELANIASNAKPYEEIVEPGIERDNKDIPAPDDDAQFDVGGSYDDKPQQRDEEEEGREPWRAKEANGLAWLRRRSKRRRLNELSGSHSSRRILMPEQDGADIGDNLTMTTMLCFVEGSDNVTLLLNGGEESTHSSGVQELVELQCLPEIVWIVY
ncbi:hypothetical protein FRC04_009194 [Tulasnella sp. 424]|nr:hypothetical protein FRC04_009194 [Tulasnella sp. 424]